MSWTKKNVQPGKIVSTSQEVEVDVLEDAPVKRRVSLGLKQCLANPWEVFAEKFPPGTLVEGDIKNITEFGLFIGLDGGVDGMVHLSDLDWNKSGDEAIKDYKKGDNVKAVVLDVDPEKRRVSLGLKQCLENPWDIFLKSYPVGSEVEGDVKNITEFGLFIGLDGDVDGMVHMSDLAWNKTGEEAMAAYKKGDHLKAVVLDVDVAKERISLGVKQLEGDPFETVSAGIKKGDIVTCTVTEVQDGGIEVSVGEGMHAFIRRAELSRDRSEQRPERFGVGDKVDARVTNIDKATRKMTLSIKAREITEEKEAVAQYGSSDSGASLGDILGAALSKAQENKKG